MVFSVFFALPDILLIEKPIHVATNEHYLQYDLTPQGFMSGGERCDARLYHFRVRNDSTVIIMAHGFGARIDFGLLPFAEGFLEDGYAIFMFDYRGFGESEGKPRNLVSPLSMVYPQPVIWGSRTHSREWEPDFVT